MRDGRGLALGFASGSSGWSVGTNPHPLCARPCLSDLLLPGSVGSVRLGGAPSGGPSPAAASTEVAAPAAAAPPPKEEKAQVRRRTPVSSVVVSVNDVI